MGKRIIDLKRLGNYDYYSPNLLYIQAGEGLVKFDFNDRYVQVEVNRVWNGFIRQKKPVLLIILKARRHGVSTYVQSRMFQQCHLRSHRQGITISADDEGCSYIHNMSHVFYEYLPRQLKPMVKYKSSSRLVFDAPSTALTKIGKSMGLKSSMRTVSCTDKAGLSTGNHFIHFSEYAFYRDADAVRKAVVPTTFNLPGTFVVIESTANGMAGNGEPFYDEWKKATAGKSVFKPLFFSWLKHEGYTRPLMGNEREELLDTFNDEEVELRDVHNATLEQLNWRRYQISFLGEGVSGNVLKTGLENFHEQYPTTDDEAFVVSGRTVFDRDKLKKYLQKCSDPVSVGEIDGSIIRKESLGSLKIWERPVEGERYVVSIDPSSGEPGSTDFGCLEVLRVMDMRQGWLACQAAEWHGKVDAEVLGNYAVALGTIYNNALLVPEVFGYGHAVLSAIQKAGYWNVIRRVVRDSINEFSNSQLGWMTTAQSKPDLLTHGRYCVNNGSVIIHSAELVREMMIFVRDDTSQGASAYGKGKDDRVMAFLIGIKGIQLEYGGTNIDALGVMQPSREREPSKKNPLYYDTFGYGKTTTGKSWLDL